MKRIAKITVALLLAVAMCFSLAGCYDVAIYEDHMPHAPLEEGDVFINYHGLPAEE